MKINDQYEIRIVILELRSNDDCPELGDNYVGDVYDSFEAFREEHPDSDYKFGYVVYDNDEEIVPDECEEWYETPEQAIEGYLAHCVEVDTEEYILCYTDYKGVVWEVISGEDRMLQRVDELCVACGLDESDVLVFRKSTQLY